MQWKDLKLFRVTNKTKEAAFCWRLFFFAGYNNLWLSDSIKIFNVHIAGAMYMSLLLRCNRDSLHYIDL